MNCNLQDKNESNNEFSFSVRAYADENVNHFRGVCEQLLLLGEGDFMVSPGDMDPPAAIYSMIEDYFGEDFEWYPVIGNHEAETASDMNWLRDFNKSGITNSGPINGTERTYSFDISNIHIIILNEYYNGISDIGTDGDIDDSLYNWLIEDLLSNRQPVIFVFGHEPVYPQPDADGGEIRHLGDSLDKYPSNRDRFWVALEEYNVKAYIYSHTHYYSKIKINDVWQIDAGNTRGTGSTGTRSTSKILNVMSNENIWCYTYRQNNLSLEYELTDMWQL